MSTTDHYFQFPVRMLLPHRQTQRIKRKDQDTPAVVQRIVNYGLWHYGLKLHAKVSDQIPDIAEQYQSNHPDLKGVNRQHANYYEQQIIMASAVRLGVDLGHVTSALDAAKKEVAAFGAKGTQCRIRFNILWSAHNDDWPILKFKTLCGVYAGIGDSKLIRLNTRVIQALGAGYDSPKGVTKWDLIPQASARYWLDQLWYQNLFQHCKRGAERWYSIRHADDAALAVDVKRLPVRSGSKIVIDVNKV